MVLIINFHHITWHSNILLHYIEVITSFTVMPFPVLWLPSLVMLFTGTTISLQSESTASVSSVSPVESVPTSALCQLVKSETTVSMWSGNQNARELEIRFQNSFSVLQCGFSGAALDFLNCTLPGNEPSAAGNITCANVSSSYDPNLSEYRLSSTAPIIISRSTDFTNGLTASEMYSRFHKPFQICMYSFETASFVLSIFNVLVYSQKRMRSPTSCYLIAYSAAEILAMAVEFVPALHASANPSTYSTTQFYLIFGIFVLLYLRTIITRFMLCLTCLISIMSFFAVSFPLNRKMRHVFRAPLLFIIVTFLTLAALHVNILLMYDVFLNDVTADGSEVYSFQYTQLYIRYRLVFVYWALTLRCVLCYATLVLLLVVNALVVISLRSHNRQRLLKLQNIDERKKERQEHQVTLTVLVSTILRVLLKLPLTTIIIVSDIIPGELGFFGSQYYTFLLIYDVSLLCDLFSFITDFTCYILMSSAFRSTFRGLVARAVCLVCRRRSNENCKAFYNRRTVDDMKHFDYNSKTGDSVRNENDTNMWITTAMCSTAGEL